MSGILNAFFGGNYGAKPDAPTVGTATATGTTTATLTFSAPAFDGGVPITSYTATSSPGGITSTLNQSGGGTCNITGLTTGTAYTFTVTATNAIGTSASSGASNSITTYSVPVNTVAPVVSGTATYGQTLSTTTGTWTGVPSSFSYGYQWQRSGSNIGGATGATYQLTSSDVGYTIRCVVTATNTAGSTAANSNSTATVTAIVPSAPQSVSASASGSTTANVSWSAPADNGGAAITSYSIYWSGGSTSTGSTSVGVGGLTASTSYTFTVYATNSAGTGSGTASNSITTSAPRDAALYTSPGSYTFVVPAGVTSISVAVTSGGGRGRYGNGGGGGSSMGYNNISVSPGQSFQLYVGAGNTGSGGQYTNYGGNSYFYFCGGSSPYSGKYIVAIAAGCQIGGNTGGNFDGTYPSSKAWSGRGGNACGGGGGAGAGWYNSTCGGCPRSGGAGGGRSFSQLGGSGRNGGGGGGGGGYGSGAGGGTNYVTYGAGSSGSGGSGGGGYPNPGGGGGGGSGGGSGANGNASAGVYGGSYGGGGGGSCCICPGGYGADGAVRIIWPGNVRQYPTTCIPS